MALAIVSVGVGILGILLAYRRYVSRDTQLEEGGRWDTLLAGYHVDDLYGRTIVAPGKAAAEVMAFTADAKVVDGAVNGLGGLVKWVAARFSKLQTGLVRSYGVGILAGVVAVVVWLLIAGGGIF